MLSFLMAFASNSNMKLWVVYVRVYWCFQSIKTSPSRTEDTVNEKNKIEDIKCV